jgi:hypothetical protein
MPVFRGRAIRKIPLSWEFLRRDVSYFGTETVMLRYFIPPVWSP